MALFEDKILNPEERIGGFDSYDSDDQSFQLEKIGQYPGELPDIGQKKVVPEDPIEDSKAFESSNFDDLADTDLNSTNEITPNEEFDNQIQIPQDNSEGSLWDNWDNNIDVNSSSEPNLNIEDNLENPPIEDDTNLQEITQQEAPSNQTDFSEIDNELGEIKVTSDSNALLDEEFLKELQKEIDKSKGNRNTINDNLPLDFNDMTDREKIKNFVGVEDSMETTVFNFSEIKASNPSKYILEDEIKPNAISQTDNTNQNQEINDNQKSKSKKSKSKEIKITDSKKEKEKANRKPFPIKKLFIPAAALILLLIIFGLYYFIDFNKVYHSIAATFGFVNDSTNKKIDTISSFKSKSHEIHNEVVHTDSSNSKIKDTTTQHNETKIDAHHTDKLIEEKVKDTNLAQSKPIQSKQEKTSENAKKVVEKQNVVKPKPITQHITKSELSRKQIKQVEKSVSKNEIKTDKTISDEKGLYMVEVYSTPSIEDAEDWLKRLIKKNILDANISTFKIRDKLWYKVRFGKFPNKELAKEAAFKYGFSQSWIDRIK